LAVSALHRAPRPLMGWGGIVLVVACLCFLVLLAIPILRAVNRWADGEPVDLMGFAAVIGAAVPALGAIWDFVRRFMTDRHVERMDQQARGTAPESPFAPLPPSVPRSPDGGARPGDSP
jgi:hypothetical protein